VGREEACRLYRLSDIPALATINSGAKTPVIEFYPKARRFARIAGWYFKQANFACSDFINHDMTSAVVFGVEIQLRTGFCNTRSNHFCLSVLKVASAPALARPLVDYLWPKPAPGLAIARQLIANFCQRQTALDTFV
jgi:hypothetical protein